MPTSYQLLRAERNRKWAKARDVLIERDFFHRGHRWSIERGIEAAGMGSGVFNSSMTPEHVVALQRQLYAILNPDLRFRLVRIETGWFDSGPISWKPVFSDPEVEVYVLMKFNGRVRG